MILIGAAYARYYGRKAKIKIEEFNQKKDPNRKLAEKLDYLKANVFYGLKNMNDGFDSDLIYYFSQSDFETVLDRIEKLGIGIMGIEPWLNCEFYDVKVAGDYEAKATESKWYRKAFMEFKNENENLLYAASYNISEYN
jgi:hypothetical protein